MRTGLTAPPTAVIDSGMGTQESRLGSVVVIALGISLVLANLRLWIFASLGLNEFSRLSLLLPFALLVVAAGPRLLKGPWRPLEWALLGSFALSIIHLLASIQLAGLRFSRDLLPFISSTAYFIPFPILLLRAKMKERPLVWILDLLALVIIPLGSGILLWISSLQGSPVLQHHFVQAVQEWLLPGQLAAKFGETYLPGPPARTLGHLFYLASSGTALGALGNYALFRGISLRRRGSVVGGIVLWVLALAGAYSSTALESVVATAVAAVVVLAAMSFAGGPMRLRPRTVAIGLVLVVGLLAVMAFSLPFTAERLLSYGTHWSKYDGKIWPKIEGCRASDLFWIMESPLTAVGNPGCTKEEFNFFWPMSLFGIIPTLGWYLWFLSPLIRVRAIFRNNPAAIPSLALVATFFLGSPHANPLQFWGNNFIYAIAWAVMFSESRRMDSPA